MCNRIVAFSFWLCTAEFYHIQFVISAL